MTQWEIDFLKYDSCLYNGGVASRARYEAMSRALNATGRKVFFQTHGSILPLKPSTLTAYRVIGLPRCSTASKGGTRMRATGGLS